MTEVALRSAREPRDVARDRRDYYRWLDTEKSVEFGSTFEDRETGEVHSYAHWAPTALEAQQQFELDLPGYSKNHMIRKRLAEVLEQRVLPLGVNVKYVSKVIERLRRARWSGAVGYSLAKGKTVVYWDEKAGLSRLCPDDAREESQRLSRKVLDPLEACQAAGDTLHYAVFTTPNVAAGRLRSEMASIMARFRRLILKARYADGSPVFPEIKGALCVLEAPLGSQREWNVHVNVILVAGPNGINYQKLRNRWHWNVEIQQLAQGPGVVKGALCELIKYAVAATVAKSAEKATAGNGGGGSEEKRLPPPPMLDWTGSELLEWLRAMRGFRRTRTYGCLFKIKKPEREDLGQIVWLGRIDHDGGRYRVTSALIDSIPEDNSHTLSGVAAYVAMLRGLALPGLKGASTIGADIPRDVLHTLDEKLILP